jgi:general secretion pathway protein B
MSYILEALKKAQAERQLGNSPTIHAPTLQTADSQAGAGRISKQLILAVLAMAGVIGVLLVLVLRPSAAPEATQAAAATTPAAGHALAPVVTAAAPTPVPAPLPVPDADLPPSVANLARASASTPAGVPAQAAVPTPATAAAPGVAAPAQPTAKPVSASEEPVANLRELPEPIQRSIPPVSVGGYIYSKNAADRLLLVDKILRHEGEEVAPGLVLEKLQPKEAIFNFKGYRYRVPY